MAIDSPANVMARTTLAAISSSVISAGVYFWLAPLLAPTLSGISRPADSFPWWAPAAVKAIETVVLSSTSLSNPWDAACLGTIGRAPFLELLYTSFLIPWHTVLTLYIVDIVSLFLPQYFLAGSTPPHTPYDDTRLFLYTSLLSATFLSLPLYYLSTKFLPMTLVTYFDGAKSIAPLPIPMLIALNLPVGYSLETLLTRYGVKGAVTALANVLVTGTAAMYYGISGAELKGVQNIETMWLVSLAVSIAATYIFVLRK